MSDKGLKDEVLSSQQGIVLTPEQVRGRRVRSLHFPFLDSQRVTAPKVIGAVK